MPRPMQSMIWSYFKIDEYDRDKSQCKICNNTYSRKGRTTTSLKSHLKSMHPEQFSLFSSAEEEQLQKRKDESASACKTRWYSLRDQWRKKVIKSATSKKWRYENEMSFLKPFIRERNTLNNLPIEDNEKTEEIGSVPAESKDETEEDSADDDDAPIVDTEANSRINSFKRKRSQILPIKKRIQKTPETASSVLMKYLLNKQEDDQNRRLEEKDKTDKFFDVIAEKVKRFSPYYRNLAETKIFTLIQEMELQQIMEQQPGTSTQQNYFNEELHNNYQPSPSPVITNVIKYDEN